MLCSVNDNLSSNLMLPATSNFYVGDKVPIPMLLVVVLPASVTLCNVGVAGAGIAAISASM